MARMMVARGFARRRGASAAKFLSWLPNSWFVAKDSPAEKNNRQAKDTSAAEFTSAEFVVLAQ